MELTHADVYTGTGEVLERVAGAPADPRRHSITVTERERPAVVRAMVSGNPWAKVWLPELETSNDGHQLRVAPIRNAGELLGLLVVERATSAEPFSEDDDRVLADLAREVGLALHNVQLDSALQDTLAELRVQAAELRESRARIVASGDAVRRRLERDIHDGAQQNLAALAIELRLAHDLISTDPARAANLLEGMNAEVQQTIRELRELAHGIYPPLLADGGLGPALDATALRSPLDVSVDVSTTVRFDQNTEAAVYFCCLEALQNSAKHAPGATVGIRVWSEPATLFFQVTDDGPGFDPATTPRGHGLINMADRLGAIGGTVRWRSSPGGGMEVSGSVPLKDEQPVATGPR
jgi:signal transduction histidine kinase